MAFFRLGIRPLLLYGWGTMSVVRHRTIAVLAVMADRAVKRKGLHELNGFVIISMYAL